MRVASLCPTISSAGGGVVPAVRGLNQALVQAGLEVTTHAALEPLMTSELSEWDGLNTKLHPVRSFGPLRWQTSLRGSLANSHPDVLHLHGLWLHPSLVSVRYPGRDAVRAKIISPHGMLDSWALRNSRWKKRIALTLFERANLDGATCLHALNRAECDAIREAGFTAPVAIIPNGVDLAELAGPVGEAAWSSELPPAAKVLLFIGRLHPKKGISRLIEAFSQLSSLERGEWHVVIAGWDQGGHFSDLKELACQRNIADRVHFVGPQFGHAKRSTFNRADAFVLPSVSEGLPIAVLEAFSFGLPVLMTDACNMPESFEAGAAFRIRSDESLLRDDLRNYFSMNPARHLEVGRLGRRMAERYYTWEGIGLQMKQVYLWSLGEGDAPDCLDIL
ncbi:glycosyltransferase [Qipengyuania flava]|uniref:glycosyltransferase n=1 Tax=Qipengyuania flava TaxID=192812 RepID=UPI001FB8B8EB|nr:glycosyltransferase [Qipengyuania flava]